MTAISVIIPCYRSMPTLPPLVARLHTVLSEFCDDYEIILVVDGSPDDTYLVAEQLRQQDSAHVRTLLLRRNYGQHNALVAGLSRARHSLTVTMDDDLQHRPEEIGALVAPLNDPMIDLCYGVAVSEEHGFWRSLASRSVKAALKSAGVADASSVSAFRAFRTEMREGFIDPIDPFVSLDVLLSWATSSSTSVPVEMDRRTVGKSAYTVRALIRHALNMITGYGTLPLRAVTWLGFGCGALGFALLVNVLVQFARGEIQVAGFTTIASMVAMFSGAMLVALGIIGEYIGRLHFRSMHRPAYLIRRDSAAPGAASHPGAIRD